MIELIPAIMPKTFKEIEEKVFLVKDKVKTIQIDIMDGIYVPEKTWPFLDLEDKNIGNIDMEKQALPFWNEVNYELDLMVDEPEKNIERWIKLFPSRIIFHLGSIKDFSKIEKEMDISMRNFTKIGLAVGVQIDIEELFLFIDEEKIDFVQFMGIEKIGYQGQKFHVGILKKIEKLHEKYPDFPISIDGGVSVENIKDLVRSGITRIVSGSAIFKKGNVYDNVEKLESIL